MTDLPAKRSDPALPTILEFQQPSTAVVTAPVPRGARGTIWVVSSLFAAVAVAAGTIRVDQVVTARGEVVSRAPTMLVQPLETAIIRSIDVRVGQKVHAGQVLARLDPTFAAADVNALAAQVAALQASVTRLQAEAAGKPFSYGGNDPDLALQAAIFAQRQAEYNYKLRNYAEKIDSLKSSIQRADADAVGYRDRLRVATEVETMRRQLEKLQVGSKLNTLAAMDNRAEMQRDYLSAVQQAQAASRDLGAQVAERDGYVQSWHADVSQKLAEQLAKLSDASEQLRKAELRRQLVVLRADRAGTVLTVAKMSVGAVVQSGQKLITLTPADAPLDIEANILGSDAGYVHLGNKVAIKFDTFPYDRYGLAYGTLSLVSSNSFAEIPGQSDNSGAVPPPASGVPYYRARITIDQVKLHGTPPGFHLTPGMPVEADIKVGRQTVLSYLLEEVLPVAQNAMHEPG
ncbi:MAG: HlyD family type I secretion periplasmic adaptor subunit [Rhodospirillales bacterium]|jgi:HlyD family secretion protein|nr:HlyD family type I secretion periplasmic adaptor subunit [Rhodospirillales bacterium]